MDWQRQWLDLGAATWLAVLAFWALRRIARGDKHPLLVVFPIHFLLCGLPLALDHAIGFPELPHFPSASMAQRNSKAGVLYVVYVSGCCPLVWGLVLRFGGRGKPKGVSAANNSPMGSLELKVFILLALLPLLIVPFAPDPRMYLSYSSGARRLYSQPHAVLRYNVIVSQAAMLSLISCSLLILSTQGVKRGRKGRYVLVILVMILDAWLVGKRSAVFMAVVIFLYPLWWKGTLRGRKLYATVLLVGVALTSFSAVYQVYLRWGTPGLEVQRSSSVRYDTLRVDVGRDHVIKYCLLVEVDHNFPAVQDYRGQSFVQYLTAPIPRSLWRGKPQNFSSQVTSAVAGRAMYSGEGGLTTSALAEGITSFGLWGLVLGPLYLGVLGWLGAQRNGRVSLLTVIVIVFSMILHVQVWIFVLFLWLWELILSRRSRPSRRRGPALGLSQRVDSRDFRR